MSGKLQFVVVVRFDAKSRFTQIIRNLASHDTLKFILHPDFAGRGVGAPLRTGGCRRQLKH